MAGSVVLEQDEDTLQEYFRSEDFTDGLPIIIPTRARVDAFLEASGFGPYRGRAVGHVQPLNADATVEDVAVNALMAGAKPAHMGVLLGVVEALQDTSLALEKVQYTTNPSAPFVIVSPSCSTRCESTALKKL